MPYTRQGKCFLLCYNPASHLSPIDLMLHDFLFSFLRLSGLLFQAGYICWFNWGCKMFKTFYTCSLLVLLSLSVSFGVFVLLILTNKSIEHVNMPMQWFCRAYQWIALGALLATWLNQFFTHSTAGRQITGQAPGLISDSLSFILAFIA